LHARKNWCNPTHFDNDHSDVQSILAYPLAEEDQDTGEVIESPPIRLPSNKHLTPTSITVVDTISLFKSQITTEGPSSSRINIDLDQLQMSSQRHCKPCAIANE
jgi:hypothetical protein